MDQQVESLTDEQRKVLTDNGYSKRITIGSKFYVNTQKTKYVGYVSQIYDDPVTGEQAYIITDQYLPPNPTEEQKASVTNVSVIYKGSSSDPNDSDFYQDWTNDAFLAKGALGYDLLDQREDGSRIDPTSQEVGAAQTLNSVLGDYPNAMVDVYGHSLGSMVAQYALANALFPERIRNAYLYEGPNIWATLDAQQQKAITELKSRIFNYVDRKDLVVIGYTPGIPNVGQLVEVISTKAPTLVDQHEWEGYQFNKNGTIIVTALALQAMRMGQVDGLKAYYMQQNHGPLTDSQKIAINKLAASALGDTFTSLSDHYLGDSGTLGKVFHTAADASSSLWTSARNSMNNSIPAAPDPPLTESEKLDIFENAGAGQNDILTKPSSKYEDDLDVISTMHADFSAIGENLHVTVEKMKEADAAAAKLLQSWG